MTHFIDRIALWGIPPTLSPNETSRLRVVNLFSAFGVLVSIACAFLLAFPVFQAAQFYGNLLFTIAMCLPLLFNRAGLHRWAKTVFVAQFFAIGYVLAVVYGRGMLYEWFVPVLPAMAYFFAQKPRHGLYLFAGVLTFWAIQWVYASFAPLLPMPRLPYYEHIIGTGACLCVYLMVLLLKKQAAESEQDAVAKNRELVAQQATIAAQNDTLREANQKYEQSQQALQALNMELRNFSTHASHDMKEPLRTISSFSTLLSRSLPADDGKNRELLHFIEDAAKRMSSLLDDLISYSRAGVENAPAQPVDLNLIFERVRMNLYGQITQKNAHLEASNLPVVLGHETLLTQLFQNIIGNSLKYARTDLPPTVAVRFLKKDGLPLLTFRDNGIGIAKEHLQQIFEPFRRLHTRVEYEGSGIGLATCKKIADAYGGRIWAESELGAGTLFCVELPAELLTDAPMLAEKTAPAMAWDN